MLFNSLATEQVNERTKSIDEMAPLDIAKLINEEDKKVAPAIENEILSISKLMELVYETIHSNGRIVYIGAGTSGRLGVLDSSEMPPTFSAPNNQFNGLIAGGRDAIFNSIEGAEDNVELGCKDIESMKLTSKDLVIGLTASGRTPYVKGALLAAQDLGAKTGLICCNKPSELSKYADISVEVDVGPEVIMGSTRLKAGSAQKMVLNIISTGAMVLEGKVYKNLMVNLQKSNVKLKDRAVRIIKEATGFSIDESLEAYENCGHDVKVAIVHLLMGTTPKESGVLLNKSNGRIKDILVQSTTINKVI